MKIFWLSVEDFTLIIFLLVVLGVNFRVGGGEMVLNGVGSTLTFVKKSWTMLVLVFLLMGQAEVLVGRFQQEFKTWISGSRGIWVGAFSGFVSPTFLGSITVLRSLWDTGANPVAVVLSLISVRLLSPIILIMVIPFLGASLTLVYLAVSAGLMVCLSLIATGAKSLMTIALAERTKKIT